MKLLKNSFRMNNFNVKNGVISGNFLKFFILVDYSYISNLIKKKRDKIDNDISIIKDNSNSNETFIIDTRPKTEIESFGGGMIPTSYNVPSKQSKFKILLSLL